MDAGIVVDHDNVTTLNSMKPQAYFYVGFHGSDTEVINSENVEIVEDLISDQFSIHTCSVECMRKLFNDIFNFISTSLSNRREK